MTTFSLLTVVRRFASSLGGVCGSCGVFGGPLSHRSPNFGHGVLWRRRTAGPIPMWRFLRAQSGSSDRATNAARREPACTTELSHCAGQTAPRRSLRATSGGVSQPT